MQRLRTPLGFGFWIASFVLGGIACGDESAERRPGADPDEGLPPGVVLPADGESDFVSSLPSSGYGVGLDSADQNAATPAPGSAQDSNASGAARAISEADILQVSGDRLYALSRYNGLTVIDASNPAQLRLEGVYRTAAEPFEMYVEDGIVYAMFNGWYTYACDAAGSCGWQTQSRVQALDTRDPARIQLISDLEVPGSIADSRRVGDVLYLATEESGWCWGCDFGPNTTVTSFDLSTPGQFTQLDQLRLPSPEGQFGYGRSIAVTEQRIYVSGYEYDVNGYPAPGAVQVVDISDPGGALVQGARFEVAGPIQSRWQMDEHDGVFRVISQPGGWGTERPPVLQTFTVASANEVQPLASLTIQLPRREVLQSARFDGTRAYAITAEQIDPLFTFDLSDPAAPRQMGELEMPGWVYHMEPRGDRMFALGFDPQATEGSLHVSLFDVADLSQPRLLSRVAFGGTWGSFAEGQNQIHKAFSILPEQGLILVPFSGTTMTAECSYDYESGIQLVDFTDTALTRRGVAPQVGSARRSFLHRDHLFGVGDNAVQTFDISNRDQPVERGQLDVARNISTVRALGDHILRFGSDWLTNQTILDLTTADQADRAEPAAEIDLSALFGEDTWSCNGGASWTGQVFTRGDYAYVPRMVYSSANGSYEQRLAFYVVDYSDRAAPRAVGRFDVEPFSNDSYMTGIVQTENTLLVGRTRTEYGYDDRRGTYASGQRFYYDVIELSDPSAPTIASRFEVPEQAAGGGWGVFALGCSVDMAWGWYGGYGSGYGTLTDGDMVISQHSEPVEGGVRQVRYYLDRIDVSDPHNPRVLPPINIPGSPIHFNAETGELVTLDFTETAELSSTECGTVGYYSYTDGTNNCIVSRRTLSSLIVEGDRAVRKSKLLLDRDTRAGMIAVSDERIFYVTTDFPVYEQYGQSSAALPGPVRLESLRLEQGSLVQLPSIELREMHNAGAYYYGQLYARGERVFEIFDNTLTVVDTHEPTEFARLSRELPGWGCQSLEVAGDTAYCAVGQRGVEVIDLSSMR